MDQSSRVKSNQIESIVQATQTLTGQSNRVESLDSSDCRQGVQEIVQNVVLGLVPGARESGSLFIVRGLGRSICVQKPGF